ncbi:pyridoxamine 5'-phosphate oxidase family protein [Mycobacterium sp. 141]|uniref:pyridoxamine 5'-phosphate oxidase family protein n=1 Tax=Mycobacterium sp. 141 TaxID=1120797 RepID=UPI00037A3C63|nr:pyridoxamine 5'-phosphate oxidase family protein [Mycobacterium sp. 141]
MEKLTRKQGRQPTERAALEEFLDGQWWGVLTIGSVERRDGRTRPLAVPTLFVRHEDRILMHGSTGAGAMGAAGTVTSAAFCVTAMDALVVAHSTFDSTVHYRSAVLYGDLQVAHREERAMLLDRFSDLLLPGRTAEVRGMTPKEIAATNVVAMPITDGDWVYKVNDSPVKEPDEDTDVWAGTVPFIVNYGAPHRASWSSAELPDSVRTLVAAGRVSERNHDPSLNC